MSKTELEAYLARIEEAKRRDHRKLGRELDLFAVFEEGPGFPFFFPNGMVIRNELENYWRDLHRTRGYQEIKTPIILNEDLWHRSGHWDKYKENMYFTEIDEGAYAVKPMNCRAVCWPKRRMWSYKDLPLRVGELGLVRMSSPARCTVMRVRALRRTTPIFMTEEQMAQIRGVIEKIDSIYATFGFDYYLELSTCGKLHRHAGDEGAQ